MEEEKFEGAEIDTSRMEEYRKRVPFEVRVAAMRRMAGFPELDDELDEENEEDGEDGEPAHSEA